MIRPSARRGRARRPATRGIIADRRGGIAVLFALTIVPILLLVALGIDFSSAAMAKSRLNLAADAATLAASRRAANAYAANATDYLAQGQAAGLQFFNAQAGQTSGLTIGPPTLTVTRTGGVFTSSLTFQGSMTTMVASIFGVQMLPLGGNSTATTTVGGYADIEILMDLSSSMGIAATQAGMVALGDLVYPNNKWKNSNQNQKCAFACHWDSKSDDFYGVARDNAIQLRIDVLSQAVQGVITTLNQKTTSYLYRIGLYSFDAAFKTVYPLSSNIAGSLTAEQSITVPVIDAKGSLADTNFPLAMQSLTNLTAISGDGSSATSPRKFVFLVTDGVMDYIDGSGNRIVGAMTAANCTALKAKGARVLVLYTQYIPLDQAPLYDKAPYFNAYYHTQVAPTAPDIVPNLKACASSPNDFFQATSPDLINATMQQMLLVATSAQGRFSQ